MSLSTFIKPSKNYKFHYIFLLHFSSTNIIIIDKYYLSTPNFIYCQLIIKTGLFFNDLKFKSEHFKGQNYTIFYNYLDVNNLLVKS